VELLQEEEQQERKITTRYGGYATWQWRENRRGSKRGSKRESTCRGTSALSHILPSFNVCTCP